MLQMDAKGKMIVPTTAKITNNTEGKGIEIQNIQIDLAGEWEYAAYSKEFQEGETNKQIALKLRSDEMDETGNVGLTADNWKVPADSSIDLTIDARIPKQTVSGTYNNLATISFTIGLSDGENGGGGKLDPDPSTIYEITFTTPENGTLSSVDPIETSEDGTIESLPTAIPDEGYYFKGWQDQDGNPVAVGDKITTDTELKAIFEESPGYTITFKAPENGTLSSLVPITTDNLGNIQNLPTATPNSGYEFKSNKYEY